MPKAARLFHRLLSHISTDTTQTAGEPSWNQSGTLFEGIERWAERKAMLTHEDVKARAMQTLKWQMANGIGTFVLTLTFQILRSPR